MSAETNAQTRVEAPARRMTSLAAIGRALRRWAIFIVLGLLVVLFQSREPAFLTPNNLFSVLQSVAVVALLGA